MEKFTDLKPKMDDIVTIIGYGEEKKWSRKKALDFFFGGMEMCEGCERERYAVIFAILMRGGHFINLEMDI